MSNLSIWLSGPHMFSSIHGMQSPFLKRKAQGHWMWALESVFLFGGGLWVSVWSRVFRGLSDVERLRCLTDPPHDAPLPNPPSKCKEKDMFGAKISSRCTDFKCGVGLCSRDLSFAYGLREGGAQVCRLWVWWISKLIKRVRYGICSTLYGYGSQK